MAKYEGITIDVDVSMSSADARAEARRLGYNIEELPPGEKCAGWQSATIAWGLPDYCFCFYRKVEDG